MDVIGQDGGARRWDIDYWQRLVKTSNLFFNFMAYVTLHKTLKA